MNEIHRIARHNAEVYFYTPHFSSINSYKDPTHIWHLASGWYSIFTESYLNVQVPLFKHQKTQIIFGSSVFNFIPKLMIKLKGVEWWEKKYAFRYNARNIITTLSVIKK